MGRKPADFWRHAERRGNRFKCKFCKQVLPGGVVRLRAHLSGITGQGIQVCSKVPEDVKSAAVLAMNRLSKNKSKIKPASSNSNTSFVICDARCSNDEVDISLAKFLEMNDINCSIVESPSFINLVNMLIKSGSGYTLPSCSTLENQLNLSIRKEVEQYVSTARQSWEEIGCTLVFDIWRSDKEKRSFISIMACSRNTAVLLGTFEAPNDNLTAAFLEKIVHHAVDYVGADNVVQYFVDDTRWRCSKDIAKLLTSECPHVIKTRCVVRELQSFFDEVQEEVECVRDTFENAKCLVDAIYEDGDLLALMRKCTGGKELKQSAGYDMLESIFEVREELVKFAQSPEWLASGSEQQENGKKATAIITSQEFWEHGEEVLMALKPLSTILHLDDAFDSSFSYLYGLVKVAEEVIARLQTNKLDKYQKLWSIFELKKSRIIHQAHKAAAFLNPAYLCNAVRENADQEITQMQEGIDYIIEKFVAAADRVAFVEQAMHYHRTLSDPSEHFKTIALKTSTPYEWWNMFGNKFPILKKYAIRILCQPCGSSSYGGRLGCFRANLIKQRGLVPELNGLNVRMSLFLMEKCKADTADKRKKLNFEEFGQLKSTNGNSDAALVEPRHNDEETRALIITSEELQTPKHLKLRFMTVIASPIFTGRKVEGHQGYPIYVHLVYSDTDCVVQEEAQSMLTLTISVFDADFTNEASTDECRTREYFDSNDLCSDMRPLVTGDLQVILDQGVGILGGFSFNYSSRITKSGKFRLAVKSDTGYCEGIRILEGISSPFVVEDIEVSRTQHPTAYEMHLPEYLAHQSFVARMECSGGLELILGESSAPGDWNGLIWKYNQLQRSCRSLIQAAARRVKKKALLRRSRSCNLRIKMKRTSREPLDKEKIGIEVFEAAGGLLAISNNVNQKEHDGESGETTTNEVATCPSTALQLSLTGEGVPEPQEVQVASANDVNQQEDGVLMALKGETHDSPTAQVMLTTEDSKEDSNIGVRNRPLDRYDAGIPEPEQKSRVLVGTFDTAEHAAIPYDAAARQFPSPYAKTNFPITSEPKINLAGKGNHTNEDDTPQEVEENQCVNSLSSTSLAFIPREGVLEPREVQGPFGMTHQEALAQVMAQAQAVVQVQSQIPNQTEENTTPPRSQTTNSDVAIVDPPVISQLPEQSSQTVSYAADNRPANDGYNWRKYGQKQVKGSAFPPSYYKCSHPNCPVKKKLEHALDGHVREIIYKGQHNHPPPQKKRAKESAVSENSNAFFRRDQELSETVPELSSLPAFFVQSVGAYAGAASDGEEVDDSGGAGIGERDEDEPEAKKRNMEVAAVPEQGSAQRTLTESGIIVLTRSEVELFDDGYRWRKYGQKVVKGNPYPRSYYKCAMQGCDVRKCVERAAADPKSVITTYEGKHITHPHRTSSKEQHFQQQYHDVTETEPISRCQA